MIPDDKTMCHRTGFEKKCRDMVVNCNCKLWARIVGKDPVSGVERDEFGCYDILRMTIDMAILKAVRENSASTDQLRNEVIKNNDENMAGAISRLNLQMDEARQAIANGADEPKLLE